MNSNEGGETFGGSTLLSLSLFIILLAFFIVLNAISNYSEPKVDAVFDSIDLAFDTQIIANEFEDQSSDEREVNEDGAGDSMEDMQSMLRSLLPGLDIDLTDAPNSGQTMAIRMKKDQFEKMADRLFPVFARILTIKDGEGQFDLMMVTSVRDPLSSSARRSYDIIKDYKDIMIEKGLDANRVILTIAQGNPAFLTFRFEGGLNYGR